MTDLAITITLTAGSANFTIGTINGAGGGDLAAYNVKAGDLILIQSRVAVIATLTGALTGTIEGTWGGTTTALAAGKLRYQGEASRLTAALYSLINALGTSVLTGIGQLTGFAAGQLVRVTNGSGGVQLIDEKALIGGAVNTATAEPSLASGDKIGFWDVSASAFRCLTIANLASYFGIESGSWTPVFQGITIAGEFTYTRQHGRYIKLGSVVILPFDVESASIVVAPTGTAAIGGVPVPIVSTILGGGAFGFNSAPASAIANFAGLQVRRVSNTQFMIGYLNSVTQVTANFAAGSLFGATTRLSGFFVGITA
jgi:hypothetical protein